MRYLYMPTKMGKTKQNDNRKCRQGCRTNETIIHCWEMGVGEGRSVIQSI